MPPFLIPRRLAPIKVREARGNAQLAIFRLAEITFANGDIGDSLRLRVTSSDHGSIEPSGVTTLLQFQSDLAATRDEWAIDED
jgi:hypothetical protein